MDINAATTINASATSVGDGGKVIVWADNDTTFAGTIFARGGSTSGNGGFVEVSGKSQLNFAGNVDTRAPYGTVGTLLFDPADYYIDVVGGPTRPPQASVITNTDLQNQLANNNVLIETNNAINPGRQNGDIFVNAPVVWNAATTLTLSAFRNVQFNDNVTVSNTGTGSLVVRADNSGQGGARNIIFQQFTMGSRVNWTASTGTVSFYENPPNGYNNPTNFLPSGQGVGRGVLTNSGVPGQFTSYMLINSVPDLLAMRTTATTLARTYALGRDIDATGFSPTSGANLTGILDGHGGLRNSNGNPINYTISNLTLGPGLNPVGLFNFIDPTGVVRNLNFSNVNIAATRNLLFLGTVAGENQGTIDQVKVLSGDINGGSFTSIIAGGVVGVNRGTVSNSSSAANVTVGNATSLSGINIAGGLVGSNLGTITLSSASGNIIGGSHSHLGGLAGQNGLTGMGGGLGDITLSSATGNVSSMGVNAWLGGLVGFNTSSGEVSQVSASGNVTSTGQAVNGGPNCNASNSCQNITVGGLIGQNSGLVSLASASGAVHAGSGGTGGGLIGRNDGIVDTTYAVGPVTGAAGIPGASENFDNDTTLGGLIGSNQGLLTNSYATGNVGSPGVNWLTAGELVGDNSGLIALTYATGNVRAGNFSMAGELVGSGDSGCMGCSMGVGSIYSNLNHISSSSASGAVSVGSSSIAGGFAGGGSFIYDSQSSGNVTGGSNSLLGGFVGVHNIDGQIYASSTTGSTVTATGPNSWVGGFVGYNGGLIVNSTTSSTVTGTSSSVLGGFAAVNIGWIDPSVANGAVTATGANNILGGFAGLNLGTIDNSTSTGAVTGGDNSIVGGFVGANAAFANFSPGLISASSFPAGTVNNSTASGNATGGAGSTVGAQIAATNPGTLPIPGLIQNCADTMCEIFRNGVFAAGQGDGPIIPNDGPIIPNDGPIVPNQVQAPPVFQYMPDRQFQATDALIRLTNLTNLVQTVQQQTNANRQTGPSQTPGTPPASLAPPRPLRAVPGPDGEIRSNVPPLNETRFLANEIVLHVMANTTPASVQQIAQQLGLTLITQQNLSSLGRTAYRLQIGGGRSVRDIIRALEANSIVAVAQPNYTYSLVQQVPAAIAPFTASRGDPAQYTMGKLESQRGASRRVRQQHHRRGDRLRGRPRPRRARRHDLATVRRHRFRAEGAFARHRDGGRHRLARAAARHRAGRQDPGGARLQRNVRFRRKHVLQHPQGHGVGDQPGCARHQHELRRSV